MLQSVGESCRVMQSVADGVAEHHGVLQCSVLHSVTVYDSVLQCIELHGCVVVYLFPYAWDICISAAP